MKTIALPELMAIHSKSLIERPGDFCSAFRSRGALAACLFQAADYVQAQRERTRMLREMQVLYENYDVFVTAGSPGPAPRLDSYKAISYWQKPNITTAFSVAGAPALVLCNGYSQLGLPLGLQIAGKPFDDATVLKVAHAYEQATSWRDRRPVLVEGAKSKPLVIDSRSTEPPNVDDNLRQFIKMQVKHTGWTLTESQFRELLHSAPYAYAMIQRLNQRRDRDEEPASVFRASQWSG